MRPLLYTEVSGASSIPAAEPRPAEPAADKGSAPQSRAKAGDDAEATAGAHQPQADAEPVSRLATGRTVATTSENGRDGGERPAPNSEIGNSEAGGTAATVSTAIDTDAGPVAGSAPATHSDDFPDMPPTYAAWQREKHKARA